MVTTFDGWFRVDRKSPCPICEKPDWCTVSPDGGLVCCMRTNQGALKALKNGGYLFRIGAEPQPRVKPKPLPRAPWVIPYSDMGDLPGDNGTGIDSCMLDCLGAWWSKRYDALAVPMFDAKRKAVGARIRARDGDKWSWPGGSEGVFLPSFEPLGDPVFIVEGPTDCAAMLSIGLWACGRPSNVGGLAILAEFCKGLRLRNVGIIRDRDQKEVAAAATRKGAEALAVELSRFAIVRVFSPPSCKDTRAWIQAGATMESILCVWRQANTHCKTSTA